MPVVRSVCGSVSKVLAEPQMLLTTGIPSLTLG